MSAPARLPAQTIRAPEHNWSSARARRPELVPLAALGMPAAMLPCAALTAAIGAWALVAAAAALVLIVGLVAWSTGGER